MAMLQFLKRTKKIAVGIKANDYIINNQVIVFRTFFVLFP